VTALQRNAITVAAYTALSVAFTWPLALDPLGQHLSRQFDIYTLLWLIGAAPDVGWDLHTELASWPMGQSLGRADTFLVLGVAKALVGWVDPRALLAACAIGGPVVSAWAAERLAAREVGAEWPWSLLAGTAYGFSGLTATALLEGHLYGMVNPWLPLLAWALLRATGRRGSTSAGALAGLFWVLALLTSAYAGLAATVLGAVVLARAAWVERLRLAPMAAAAAIALPVGLAYVALFVATGPGERADVGGYAVSPIVSMAPGSAQLATLASWHLAIDVDGHSIAPTLGFTTIALTLFAPRILAAARGWRVMFATGITGLVLSLGPTIQLIGRDLELPWVLWPLASLPGASFFHFPVRLFGLAALGFGCVAARVARELHPAGHRLALALLPMAVADALIGTGVLFRSGRVPLELPSAYAKTPEGRAILDLLPRFHHNVDDLELAQNNLTCAYQPFHGRPLLNVCLGTTVRSGPRWVVSSWLTSHVLSEEPPQEVPAVLARLGIGAVMFHPDLFTIEDRIDVRRGLDESLGPAAAETTDGGEYVVMYTVPEAGSGKAAARRETYAALAARFP
jgi:hypothetical protein